MKSITKKVISIFVIVTLLFISNSVLAVGNAEIQELTERRNVFPYKTWNIKFNHNIELSSIENNIVIKDSNDKIIPVEITLNEENQIIIVKAPKEGYKNGETYYLNIGKNLKSPKAKGLKKSLRMKFTIQAASQFSASVKVQVSPMFPGVKKISFNSVNLPGVAKYEMSTNTIGEEGRFDITREYPCFTSEKLVEVYFYSDKGVKIGQAVIDVEKANDNLMINIYK